MLTLILLIITLLFTSATTATSNRRLLHQPLFSNSVNQPISVPPSPSPQPQPFSTFYYPPIPTLQNPFFPSYPPPPFTNTNTNTSSTTSAPANVSSLVIPSSTSHSSHKTISLIFSLSLFSFLLLASLIFLLIRRRRRPLNDDKIRLFHHETPITNNISNSSNSNSINVKIKQNFQRLGSPELHPLPPLPRQQHFLTTNNNSSSNNSGEDLKFSTVNVAVQSSPNRSTVFSSPPHKTATTRFDNSSGSCSPSVVMNFGSQRTTEFSSPDYFPAPFPTVPPPAAPQELKAFSTFSPSSNEDSVSRASDFGTLPPMAKFWEGGEGPPKLVGPTRVVRKGSFGNSGEIGKPVFKPGGLQSAMIWDNLKSSTFMLNEEMIKNLFIVNSSTKNAKDGLVGDFNKENEVLDPKNSRNIDILLKALNVTIEEVCEALAEGISDTLGTELLESLLKMAPIEEEGRKLKECKDNSLFKLGTPEAFLKALVDIPFAFKRVDAMLYIAKFDSEIEDLNKCFSTLESACEELKSSKMFLKLLEAVLRTGSGMNVVTNRGKAHAGKLDTLLKLVDIRSADGKTTLLHFVVQDIIKREGAHLSVVDKNLVTEESSLPNLQDEIDFRKLGLQAVSRLSGELNNVKKAATMHRDLISDEVVKLANGLTKISEVIKLNEELSVKDKNVQFADVMNQFLIKAKVEIVNIQAQEGIALSMVNALTEYFHGDFGNGVACPFRLFVVVRDFLCVLDRVCKDVGKINERKVVSSRKLVLANPVVYEVFPGLSERQQDSSTDDESSLSY